MILIPPKIVINESSDIFKEIREFYNTSNPLLTNHLKIEASSSVITAGYYQSDISCLIREPEVCRWVSEDEPNSNFSVDFLANRVELLKYSFQTMYGFRFINSWNVLVYEGDRWNVVDERHNETLCPLAENPIMCNETTETVFTLGKPAIGSQFAFTHTGTDSLNNHYFSLSGLHFYGVINPSNICTLPHPNQICAFTLFHLLCLFVCE